MIFSVRELEAADLMDALELVRTVFDEFEAPFYPAEGREVFMDFIRYPSVLKKHADGLLRFWGCFNGNGITGVIATRDETHISLLFVRREYHGLGIGRRLFNAVLSARAPDGKPLRITVNSSPYAVGFYHRLGFADTGPEQISNGLIFTPMAYAVRAET